MKTYSILFILVTLFCLACEKEGTEMEEDDYLFSLTIDNDLTEDEIEESLKGIKRIGELKITKDVANLNFLSEITNIGELRISNSNQLTNLDPIYDININKHLYIFCKNLDTLKEFNQINELTNVNFSFGEKIKTVRQNNLTKVRGWLRVKGEKIKDIDFPNLQKIEEELKILECPEMTSMSFPRLEELDQLYIRENSSLSSLGNFPQLESLATVNITNNESLSNISIIENIDIKRAIQIYNCEIEDFCFLKEKILGDPELFFSLRSSDNHEWELSDFEQCP